MTGDDGREVKGKRKTGDRKISKLILYIDGAARGNPGPAGIGGIVYDEERNELAKISQYLGETTNNVAEYTALIHTLEVISPKSKVQSPIPDLRLRTSDISLEIYSDSELLVKQLNGSYKVKNPHLQELFRQAKTLLDKYNKVAIFHISREDNATADKLANEAIKKRKPANRRDKKMSPK